MGNGPPTPNLGNGPLGIGPDVGLGNGPLGIGPDVGLGAGDGLGNGLGNGPGIGPEQLDHPDTFRSVSASHSTLASS